MITVVIPTYNRLERLRHVLTALEQQSCPVQDFEVVVVSDGSTDGTSAFLQDLETPLRLQAIHQANAGPAAARNRGIATASGKWILFLDDDVVPASQLVAEHLHLQRQTTGDTVILGPMLTPSKFAMLPWVAWEQEMLYKQYRAMAAGEWQPTARQFYTGNSSIAQDILLRAGGFDPRFKRAEDVELAYRLKDRGVRFLYNPQAAGFHYAERSFSSWLATPYAYGRNDVIFAREKGQEWIIPLIHREYQKRHPAIQSLVRLCVGRTRLCALFTTLLRSAAAAGWQAGRKANAFAAYSAIFNLRYYHGVAQQMGGRRQFVERIITTPWNEQERIAEGRQTV